MRNLFPMRSRLDIVFRDHDVRDLVVSPDQNMARIIVMAGEDHFPRAGGSTRHAGKRL